MDFRPTLRRQPLSSDLILQPSTDAYEQARAFRQRGSVVKDPEVVRKEAEERIREAGGDPQCWQLVLSENELQFGQYWGQTFRWLLSNDIGYTAATVASHLKEREGGDTSHSALAAHKDALTSYAQLFPEVVAAVQWTRRREGTLSVRDVDQEPVGFGPHALETYRSLYESTSNESQTYVEWVRTVFAKPGSKLHNLQAYVLGRDREEDADPVAQPAAPQPAAPQPAAPQPAAPQPAAPQPAASGAEATCPELIKSELVTTAMEVDSQLTTVSLCSPVSSSFAPPAAALPPPQPQPATVIVVVAPPLTSGLWAPSSQPDPKPHPKTIKEEEEDNDVIGPDGYGGYQHTIRLAHALLELRHQFSVTPKQVREITMLWHNLSERDKAASSFIPPRQVCSETQHVCASVTGVGSEPCTLSSSRRSTPESPDVSRLLETIFLELCRIHSSDRSLMGYRVSRWSSIRRDYYLIRDNVYNSKELKAAIPIQLHKVNQRTIKEWQKKRHDAVKTSITAAGLPQVKSEEMDYHQPEDASGLAEIDYGARTPELHERLTDPGATAASSSFSSARRGAGSSASSAAAPAATTVWKPRRNMLRQPQRVFKKFDCRRCGQPKTKQYGHSRYGTEHYCAHAGGKSVEQWLEEKRASDPKMHPNYIPPATSKNYLFVAKAYRRILPKARAALPLLCLQNDSS